MAVRNISKRFGGLHALSNVNMDVYHNEVMALLGDNGAGKSTLIKIISGVLTQDEGEIIYQGKKVHIGSPEDAKQLGIKTVYQNLALFPNLDVTANLFMSDEISHWGFLKKREMDKIAKNVLSKMRISIDSLRQEVGSLSGGQQHVVTIGRSTYIGYEPKVIIMDEPTAGLGVEQSAKVLELLKSLAQNHAVIFITHNLDYAFQVASRATILASGSVSGVVKMSETNREEILSLMMGETMKVSSKG